MIWLFFRCVFLFSCKVHALQVTECRPGSGRSLPRPQMSLRAWSGEVQTLAFRWGIWRFRSACNSLARPNGGRIPGFDRLFPPLVSRETTDSRWIDTDEHLSRCSNRKEPSLRYWTNLLSISTKYELDLIRPVAIKGIEQYRTEIDPVEKYALSEKYKVEEWKASTFEILCKRPDPLTVEDAEKLGVAIVTKVFRERERIRSQPDTRLRVPPDL